MSETNKRRYVVINISDFLKPLPKGQVQNNHRMSPADNLNVIPFPESELNVCTSKKVGELVDKLMAMPDVVCGDEEMQGVLPDYENSHFEEVAEAILAQKEH